MKLIRYIQGLRAGKDAHHIERNAMIDPFLADALEGFESVEGNHAERIERMQRQLSARTQKKRRYPIMWAAAAILLLLITTGGYFWILKEKPTPQLAVTTEDTSKDIISNEHADNFQDRASSEGLTEENTALNQQVQESVTGREQQSQVASTPTLTVPPPPSIPVITEDELVVADVQLISPIGDFNSRISLNSEFDFILELNKTKLEDTSYLGTLFALKDVTKSQPTGSIATINTDELGIYSNTNRHALSQELSGKAAGAQVNQKVKSKVDPYALSQAQINTQGKIGGKLADQNQSSAVKTKNRTEQAAKSISASATPLLSSVKGKVVDQFGDPIPYATIQVKGTTTVTQTDIEGYFALNAQNAEKLVTSYVGYEPIELPADTSKLMTIAMNENTAQLEEMVVIAYGRNKADDYYEYEAPTAPKPEIGYTAYRKYLSDNLRVPTDECANAKGRVVLAFHVNSNGHPYNIEVKRGVCPSADEEAIRLIKDGGRWSTGNGQVKISIKF